MPTLTIAPLVVPAPLPLAPSLVHPPSGNGRGRLPVNQLPAYQRFEPTRIVGYMTVAEYLAYERTTDERYEYWEGKVIRVAGGTPEHSMIGFDTGRVLANVLETSGSLCEVFGSDQKIRIRPGRYVYPDITIVCSKAQFDSEGALRNPILVIEVLSTSTEKDDRTDKFLEYQEIGTLQHYLLIDQSRVAVTHYERLGSGTWAIAGDFRQASDTLQITLSDIPLTVPIGPFYRRVGFEELSADAADE